MQSILIETTGTDVPFVLRFNGVSTSKLMTQLENKRSFLNNIHSKKQTS